MRAFIVSPSMLTRALGNLANQIHQWIKSNLMLAGGIARTFLLLLTLVISFSILDSFGHLIDTIGGGNSNFAHLADEQVAKDNDSAQTEKKSFTLQSSRNVPWEKYYSFDTQTGEVRAKDYLITAEPASHPLILSQKNEEGKDPAKRIYYIYVEPNCKKYQYLREEWLRNGDKEPDKSQANQDISNKPQDESCRRVPAVTLNKDPKSPKELESYLSRVSKNPTTSPSITNKSSEESDSKNKDSNADRIAKLFEISNNDKGSKDDQDIYGAIILQVKLNPGDIILPEWREKASSAQTANLRPKDAADKARANWKREIKKWQSSLIEPVYNVILLYLRNRTPVILVLGIGIPTWAYITSQNSATVRRYLEPYLLLLLAQATTMAIASELMGEGLVVVVSALYSSLRVVQLWGCIWDRRIQRTQPQRSRDQQLVFGLSLLLAFWFVNSLGLVTHIIIVLTEFQYISPSGSL